MRKWLIGLLMILGLCAGFAQAETYVVAVDGTGDFQTLTEAAAASSAGDTILLRAGVYGERETFPIVLDHAVTIEGEDGAVLDSPRFKTMLSVTADGVTLRNIRPHRKMAGRIIRIGLPTGIQNMVISFSNVLVQSSVNGYGAAAMAGFAAYMKVDGFNILPVMSFSMAATTFVGQNFGAGRLDRVKRGMGVTVAMGVGYTLCTGALLLLFRYQILYLFTSDETVVAYGISAMKYFCPFYFLLAILHGMAGAVRGTGKSVPPMVVLLLSLCLFRVAWIQFILPFFHSIEGVFLLYPVSWGLGAVLMALYAWRVNWMEHPE